MSVVRPSFYILDKDNIPVATEDVRIWARMFEETSRRIVDYTEINSQVHISTVFLGINHRFFEDGPPLIFETMIFGGPLDQECWRYSTWDDAVIGHKAMVRKAKQAVSDGQEAQA
jgi:hypothetical protein